MRDSLVFEAFMEGYRGISLKYREPELREAWEAGREARELDGSPHSLDEAPLV